MPGIVLGGYDLALVVWGICWVLLGTGMMYFIYRVMAADERQTEREQSVSPAKVENPTDRTPHGIAA